jgi:hypothetical protein
MTSAYSAFFFLFSSIFLVFCPPPPPPRQARRKRQRRTPPQQAGGRPPPPSPRVPEAGPAAATASSLAAVGRRSRAWVEGTCCSVLRASRTTSGNLPEMGGIKGKSRRRGKAFTPPPYSSSGRRLRSLTFQCKHGALGHRARACARGESREHAYSPQSCCALPQCCSLLSRAHCASAHEHAFDSRSVEER